MFSNKSHVLIVIFILWQIFVDNIKKTSFFLIDIFNISIFEIANVTFIFVIFYLLYKEGKLKIKIRSFETLFLIMVYSYILIHSYYVTLILDNSFIDMLKEIYYISRIYILPLLFLYILFKSNLSKVQRLNIIKYCTFLISSLIVVFNIFTIGYITYEANVSISNSELIFNIFDWFNYYSNQFDLLASKGLFFSGNGIAAILFMTFPITLYNFRENPKSFINIISIIMQILAMLIVGTTVSTLGMILILCCYIGTEIINKKFDLKKYIFPIILILILFIYSPVGRNLLYVNDICFFTLCDFSNNIPLTGSDITDDSIDHFVPEELPLYYPNEALINMSDENFVNAITLGQVEYLIPVQILETYPLEDNIDFWRNIYKDEIRDWREIKNLIFINVLRENGFLSLLLGVGYTSEHLYNEQDYFSEFYYYGFFGLLLLIGVYIYIFAKIIFSYFIIIKNKPSLLFKSYLIILSAFLGLIVGLFSGHVFYQPLTFYFFVLILYNYATSINEL